MCIITVPAIFLWIAREWARRWSMGSRRKDLWYTHGNTGDVVCAN